MICILKLLEVVGEKNKVTYLEHTHKHTTPLKRKTKQKDLQRYTRQKVKNTRTIPDVTRQKQILNAHPNKHCVLKVCSQDVESWSDDSTRSTPIHSEMDDNKPVTIELKN